ncbi:MAG TPA: hypothetical protein VGF81_02430 [Solirubrobacteraceae bacterium]|jgi:hypothetical protein
MLLEPLLLEPLEPVLVVPELLEPELPEFDDVEDELDDGDEAGCCRLVVVEFVVLPWDVSAATNENSPARATAAAIAQRLIRLSSRLPR